MLLQGKRILLIVAGGVAAYKSLDLVRRLRERGRLAREWEAGDRLVDRDIFMRSGMEDYDRSLRKRPLKTVQFAAGERVEHMHTPGRGVAGLVFGNFHRKECPMYSTSYEQAAAAADATRSSTAGASGRCPNCRRRSRRRTTPAACPRGPTR